MLAGSLKGARGAHSAPKEQLRPGVPQEAVTGQIHVSSEVEGLGRGRIVWLRSHEHNTILRVCNVLYNMLYTIVYNMLHMLIRTCGFLHKAMAVQIKRVTTSLGSCHYSAHIPTERSQMPPVSARHKVVGQDLIQFPNRLLILCHGRNLQLCTHVVTAVVALSIPSGLVFWIALHPVLCPPPPSDQALGYGHPR